MTKAAQTQRCTYARAYFGRCDNATVGGSAFCESHAMTMCRCGAKAIRECNYMGQFMCGWPQCADCYCEHYISRRRHGQLWDYRPAGWTPKAKPKPAPQPMKPAPLLKRFAKLDMDE